MPDTHRADPSARRTAILLLVLIGSAGALLMVSAATMRPSLEDWVRQDVQWRITIVIAALIVTASGPPLALSLYLWRFGTRVVRGERFPPSDARLVQDAPVISGDAAVRRGRALRVFAGGIAISALLIAAALLRFAVLVWSSSQ